LFGRRGRGRGLPGSKTLNAALSARANLRMLLLTRLARERIIIDGESATRSLATKVSGAVRETTVTRCGQKALDQAHETRDKPRRLLGQLKWSKRSNESTETRPRIGRDWSRAPSVSSVFGSTERFGFGPDAGIRTSAVPWPDHCVALVCRVRGQAGIRTGCPRAALRVSSSTSPQCHAQPMSRAPVTFT